MASDPRAAASRQNLDIALRRFIAIFAYIVFLDVYLLARFTAHNGQSLARVAPIVLLALPVAYAWRFVLKLSPALREYLIRLVLGSTRIRLAAGALAIAVLLLLAGSLAGEHTRPTLAGLAGVSALAARILIYTARRRGR